MARSKTKQTERLDTITEIESRGERALEWVGENYKIVLAGVALVVLVFGSYEAYSSRKISRENAASEALAKVRGDYFAVMGASPGAVEAPELANPAAAVEIRQDFADRFRAVAVEHPGTAGGAFARLEQGNLAAAGGDSATALVIWRSAVAELPARWPVAGVLHQRIAQALEASGEWEAAAESYAAAAAVAAYTFRHWALADAARCYAMADRPEKALELFAQLEAEAPDLQLSDYLRTRLRELKAAGPS